MTEQYEASKENYDEMYLKQFPTLPKYHIDFAGYEGVGWGYLSSAKYL